MREQRKKVWIDQFQTRLAIRLAGYFVLYQFAVWALFWMDARLRSLDGAVGQVGSSYGFVLTPLMAVGLGLIFIFDGIRYTHRIVGPIYRFRKTIQAMTAGEEVGLVKLRDGDLLLDMRDEFNALLNELARRGSITLTAPCMPGQQCPTPELVGACSSADTVSNGPVK